MKLQLLKRVSKIHAIKCEKAKDEIEANASYNKQSQFRIVTNNAMDIGELNQIVKEINDWAGANPVATEGEIQELLKGIK